MTANAEQIAYWNEISGPKWVAVSDVIDAMVAPIGREAMDRLGIERGQRVLDVGCGTGHTSRELAERVAPGGSVLGADISGPMLERAREKSTGVEFLQADAQTHAFERGSYDRIFSRFGVMFFDDPVAAFDNLRGAVASGGRLGFVCWQEVGKNPWMSVPAAAALQHVDPETLGPPPVPDAPGPFALADADRLRGILEAAGWADVDCSAHEGGIRVGRGMDLDGIIGFLLQMGRAGAVLREASDEVRARAAESVKGAVEPYFDGDGLVMDFATWIVSATAP